MQYPPSPSSSTTRVPTTPVPNAPYMSPKDLPPSPVTPTHFLPGYGAPAGAPYMHPAGYGAAPGSRATYGLMTPPTTPERARGQRGSAGYTIHPMFHPNTLRFNISLPASQIEFRAPFSHRNVTDSFASPPARSVFVNIIGVFQFEVRASQASGVTVGDVLEGIGRAMAQPVLANEYNCFPTDARQRVAASVRTPRRVDFLGTRVLFNAVEVTSASGGAVYCDLQLAVTAS
ncbi:uncharacterized protein B0H18DRAFT_1039367 [Fomitopsis serialis]|uniref:uncharacterized protein n=1 Tax=Fomitopsis serialis TaxID=139415 RepID=UPI002007D01E|nr:uncharacterized protein B0H18DRAFT_1039367 [Neoantrodia serialis]KAH9916033.1 hypothetical protein B0H18DRAFT_1039367 [Neoantrodia serialis]